jgi:hypothetical protein
MTASREGAAGHRAANLKTVHEKPSEAFILRPFISNKARRFKGFATAIEGRFRLKEVAPPFRAATAGLKPGATFEIRTPLKHRTSSLPF